MVPGISIVEFVRQSMPKGGTVLKFSLGLMLGLAGTASTLFAQTTLHQVSHGRGRCGCEPNQCQNCQPSPYSADGLGADGAMGGGAPVAPFGDDDLFTSNDTIASSPTSIAPNMIGDLLNNSMQYYFTNGYGTTTATVPIGAGDRRFKIADNNNPLPQDRLIFNYHHFHNGVEGFEDFYDVNRYTFGIEKTFFDGMASFEVRAPFASGLRATQTIGVDSQGVEFGDMTAVLKVLLFQTDNTIISAGLAATFPTSRDALLLDDVGAPLIRVDSEAVFLQPFIGASYMTYDGWFATFFGQMDFDITGNGVTNYDTVESGQIYNQTLLMLDAAIGKWVYRDPYSPGYITGIAPTVELHYTTTTTDSGYVGNVTNPFNRIDTLNIVGGVHFVIGERALLTVMGGAPLRTDDAGDKAYDSEFGIRFNYYY